MLGENLDGNASWGRKDKGFLIRLFPVKFSVLITKFVTDVQIKLQGK